MKKIQPSAQTKNLSVYQTQALEDVQDSEMTNLIEALEENINIDTEKTGKSDTEKRIIIRKKPYESEYFPTYKNKNKNKNKRKMGTNPTNQNNYGIISFDDALEQLRIIKRTRPNLFKEERASIADLLDFPLVIYIIDLSCYLTNIIV